MKDNLGKRMKDNYESRTGYFLPRRTYTIIRLDGKAFHTFTIGLDKPFDNDLIRAMDETSKFLCESIQGCKLAFVQSDEISLILTDFDKLNTCAYFDGNIQKIASISASMATAKFNEIFKKKTNLAFFDSRVFCIPDVEEVLNYLVWRQKDAERNSLQLCAQSMFSHKQLFKKSQADLHEMMFNKGFNWNDLEDGKKRGRFIINSGSWNIIGAERIPQNRELLKSRITPKDI